MPALKLLSWPGQSFTNNPYIPNLCRVLSEQGVAIEHFTIRRALRGQADVIHIHWPEQIFWETASVGAAAVYAAKVVLSLMVAKTRGAVVVWTVHNLEPHELDSGRAPLWRLFTGALSHLVDGATAMAPSTLAVARARFPALAQKPAAIIRHGHYRDSYPPSLPRVEARRALHLQADARIFAHVGFLRRYKGIDELVHAFGHDCDRSAVLLLAGTAQPESYSEALQRRVAEDPRIRFSVGFQTEESVTLLMSATDLIVLPFEGGLHSGSILLALSFGRRVLARKTPYLADIQAQVGHDWVRLFEGELTAALLEDAMVWARRAEGLSRQPDLSSFVWDRIGDETVAFYRTLLARTHRSRRHPSARAVREAALNRPHEIDKADDRTHTVFAKRPGQ